MRMQFGVDDEDAFTARRDELVAEFGTWLTTHGATGDAFDAGLLLDWRWGYGDGALDTWTVADVHEFLFDWCPRKLSAAPQDCAEIPDSVAAFVEFLAHTGRLAPAGDSPKVIRRCCVDGRRRFSREMGNPANFGMAKSMLGGLDLGDADLPDDPDELLARLGLAGSDEDDEDDGRAVIGPVRMPADDERLAAIRAAPAMRRFRTLAEYCAAPGRSLTGKGNLRLADARHLVEALDTGDEPDAWGSFRSAEDLPILSRLVDIAVEAGIIRRHRGRLVAVARFATLDELTAHAKIAAAAIDPDADVDSLAAGLLIQLLAIGPGGIAVTEFAEHALELLEVPLAGVKPYLLELLSSRLVGELAELADLGVVHLTTDLVAEACEGCGGLHDSAGEVCLTAAGVGVAVELAGKVGIEVVAQPDPKTADAAAIAALVGVIDQPEWVHDATAWLAAQPDRAAAGVQLVAQLTAEERSTVLALAGLEAVEEVLGDATAAAVRAQLGGAHDGLVVHWLVSRSELDPSTIDPVRHTHGLIDVLAAIMDEGEPAELRAVLDAGEPAEHLEMLDRIWRLDHPRLPDVLDAIGAQHPVKAVAKAARKASVRHRSRLASK